MALVAGTWQLSAQAKASGVKVDPQGNADVSGITSPLADAVGGIQQSLSFGTASGKADIYCAAAYSIAVSGSVVLDLYTGTDLLDLFGGDAPFRKLKSFFIGIPADDSSDSSGVTIGNTSGAGNALSLCFGANTSTWTIRPGGPPLLGGDPAGVTVDATHCNLRLVNNAAVASTVVVLLAGTSA